MLGIWKWNIVTPYPLFFWIQGKGKDNWILEIVSWDL